MNRSYGDCCYMKKNWVIRILVVVIFAGVIGGGYFVFNSLFPKANPINVPSANSVVSMTVVKNEMRKDGELFNIARTDVDVVLAKLSEAVPTREMSVQD